MILPLYEVYVAVEVSSIPS